jgi:hypothetical protein
MVVGAVINGAIVPNITVYTITATGATTRAGFFGKNVFDYGGLYGDDRYLLI